MAFRIIYWIIAIFTAYVVYKITDKNGLDGPASSFGGCILCGVLWPVLWVIALAAVVVRGPKQVLKNIKGAWVTLLICLLLPMGLRAELYSNDLDRIGNNLASLNVTLARLNAKPVDEHKGMRAVVEYRMVCEAHNTALSADITILLAQGWELYSAPTTQAGYDQICQAMTKTTWVKK